MARFPLPESKVRFLAHSIAVGLKDNPQVFVHPPVEPGTLEAMVETYDGLKGQITQMRSELLTLLEEKDRVLAKLKREMKRSLRYAEEATDFDDVQLKLLGWSAKREKRALARPNQPRLLTMAYTMSGSSTNKEKKGPVRLSWKPPVGGGKPAVYLIQRWTHQTQKNSETDEPAMPMEWTTIEMGYQVSMVLTPEQYNPVDEYRVLASNRAGVSRPSNSVGGG